MAHFRKVSGHLFFFLILVYFSSSSDQQRLPEATTLRAVPVNKFDLLHSANCGSVRSAHTRSQSAWIDTQKTIFFRVNVNTPTDKLIIETAWYSFESYNIHKNVMNICRVRGIFKFICQPLINLTLHLVYQVSKNSEKLRWLKVPPTATFAE